MKLMRCRYHGFDCEFEAPAKTEEEMLQVAAQHAQTVHGLEATPALVEQVKALYTNYLMKQKNNQRKRLSFPCALQLFS